METPQKFKNRAVRWSSKSTSGYLSEEHQFEKIVVHTYIHMHTHWVEYYSAIKRKKNLPFVTTSMNPEVIKLSEISKTKTRYHYIWSHMWYLKISNKRIQNNTETDY